MVPLLALAIACGGGGTPVTTTTTATPTTTPSTPALPKVLVLVDAEGVGLGGYDPIAYGKHDAPFKGKPAHASQFAGATYRFMSTDNKAAFDADTAKHAPQYGGYCAFAASQNRLSDSDPTVYQIVDGQLLVFTNESYKREFNADLAGNKAKADANWPGLVAKHGKEVRGANLD